jgi:hypothetical protein
MIMELKFLKAAGRTASRTAALGSIAALAIVLASCSSSSSQQASSGGSAAAQPNAGTQTGAPAGNGQNAAAAQGTFGLIAEVDGKTLQVQSSSDQTAVTYTSKTTIEQVKTVTSKDIAAGWCATVVSSTKSSSSAGTAPSKITATSVSLTKPSGSTCGGFGGAAGGSGGGFSGGQRPSGAPSNFPGGGKAASARPTNMPGGNASARANMGTFASGKITKVSGSSFVIDAVSRTRGSQSSSTARTQAVTVTLTGSSKITAQATAKSSAIKEGLCVRANGKTDSTGAVAATALVLSSATKGTCTETGFGGFGGQRGGTNG